MHKSQTQENAEGALGWIRCLERGDFPGIFKLHAEDVIVNLLGTTPVSGHVVGRDAYFNYTNDQVMTKLDPSSEPYLKGWRLACADHNAAAIFFNGSFPAKDGAPEGRYNQNYLAVAQAAGGQIRKLVEMADTAMIETAIYRHRLKVPRIIPAQPYDLRLARPGERKAGRRDDNIRLAEDWLDAIRQFRLADYAAVLREDVVVNIVGSTPYSGRTTGRQAFLDLAFDFHAALFKPGTRDIGKRYRIMCADEYAFCTLISGGGLLHDGRRYDQFYSVVAEIVDGTIAEMHIHLDTVKAEQMIFANPFVDPLLGSPHRPFSIY